MLKVLIIEGAPRGVEVIRCRAVDCHIFSLLSPPNITVVVKLMLSGMLLRSKSRKAGRI